MLNFEVFLINHTACNQSFSMPAGSLSLVTHGRGRVAECAKLLYQLSYNLISVDLARIAHLSWEEFKHWKIGLNEAQSIYTAAKKEILSHSPLRLSSSVGSSSREVVFCCRFLTSLNSLTTSPYDNKTSWLSHEFYGESIREGKCSSAQTCSPLRMTRSWSEGKPCTEK